ncbi:NADH-quinone oxidoreductase subunit L [Sphingobacterium sp. UT-1RO-CII-1]|uniref:NADH-quinone oxidoreductase subunit 5 family protein n=1 Tax=Sphingobacterium sp. UT-1RO-CII-1 TaxID=2995225 RepID=UPI00227CC69E|nr:NADH-quinone oxidoreductase subunit L [Sphingobacterium sp. UT-1RO-CII-1]MCY4779935.1 NADH-quinone oxidoreductase subunit L [Sphingobacterium sp. UT-1RO-CII-1]
MDTLFNISPIYASLAVILLPFISAVVQALLGRKNNTGNFALLAIVASTVISLLYVFIPIWNTGPIAQKAPWFIIGESTFYVGMLLNNLTVIMQFLVCIIALPVHIYSRIYMKGDPGLHRYWMYLSFFCSAMLGLTVSANLLQMYIFWELVGFASFLLIGFWFHKTSAAKASKKAFIINRIGDLGFLIGIALLYSHVGTLDIVELFGSDGVFSNGTILHSTGKVSAQDNTWITLAGLGFFLAAMAKSAQFPLHVWLPDAMEGPTSVSSLIHAATMVAAGVFLLSTIFPLFTDSVLLIITCIGTLTAVTAAIFALAQYDIKKILAFSTVSQLGFMVVGVGIGASDTAMFHLITHAFFKCLLFLCAGAVIHALTDFQKQAQLDFDSQDLRNMGGLRSFMPKTFLLMTIASLALIGIPFSSGYLSKESIIITAFEWGQHKGSLYLIIPIILVIVSIMTAFYIARLLFKTYFGRFHFTQLIDKGKAQIKEAHHIMLYPMFFLAIGSLFPLYSYNPIDYNASWLLIGLHKAHNYPEIGILHILIPLILLVGSFLSGLLAWQWYVKNKYPLSGKSSSIEWAANQGYLNEFHKQVWVNETKHISRIVAKIEHNFAQVGQQLFSKAIHPFSQSIYSFDKNIVDGTTKLLSKITRYISLCIHWIDHCIVDGIVNLIANLTYYIGHLVRQVQNGQIQTYLGFTLTMVVLGIIYLLIK